MADDIIPRCTQCGKPLKGRDRDRSTCHDCRSPQGKLADLDIAIRASGDSPNRLSEWPAIRHVLRERFGGEHPEETLWERFTDLLLAGGITANEYLVCPLAAPSIRKLISLAESNAVSNQDTPPVPASDDPSPTKPKRSTERGEAHVKLVAGLTAHHQYADGGCLNLDPIGSNELARLAGVSESTASTFFRSQFGGHAMYRAICADATRLVASLKLLNQDFAPRHLFGGSLPSGAEE